LGDYDGRDELLELQQSAVKVRASSETYAETAERTKGSMRNVDIREKRKERYNLGGSF
jgi:hypothetical protein